MKDFTYEDLNPNYLIDQYYYTRKALNKTKKASLTNLKKYVDCEITKEPSQTSFNNQMVKTFKRGKVTSNPSGFFGDYYTDKSVNDEFTTAKKVQIWLNRSSLQARANKVDILNAWTAKI